VIPFIHLFGLRRQPCSEQPTLLDLKLKLTAAVNALRARREPERLVAALAGIAEVLSDHHRFHRVVAPALRELVAFDPSLIAEAFTPVLMRVQGEARHVLGEG
jgi:hypothetical protein